MKTFFQVSTRTALLRHVDTRTANLFASWEHSGAAIRERNDLLSARANMTGRVACVLMLAWIPVDVLTLSTEALAMMVPARLATALLFFALSQRLAVSDLHEKPLLRLAAMSISASAFFVYAAYAIHHSGDEISSFAGMLYFFSALMLAAVLSLFPLTALESAIAALPFAVAAALTQSILDAGNTHSPVAVACWFAIITCISAAAGMSQLHLLLQMTDKTARDALTGAWTRAIGDDMVATQFATARRKNEPLTVLFVDLDRFKQVNDAMGHAAGDEVLRDVAHHLEGVVRKQDSVIRWGGEEFLIVLPGTDAHGALTLLRRIARRDLIRPDGSPQTLSIGIASIPQDQAANWGDLVALADERMYSAKAAGRNRYQGPVTSNPVVLWRNLPDPETPVLPPATKAA